MLDSSWDSHWDKSGESSSPNQTSTSNVVKPSFVTMILERNTVSQSRSSVKDEETGCFRLDIFLLTRLFMVVEKIEGWPNR